MSEKENQTTENTLLYELGFHIVPTVTENKVAEVFSKIKDIINKNNGSIVKEGEPKAIKLAYTIIKKIGVKNEKFDNAYFAWIKFNADSADINAIKNKIDSDPEVLRYLVLKTVNDDEHSTAKLAEEEPEEVEGNDDSDDQGSGDENKSSDSEKVKNEELGISEGEEEEETDQKTDDSSDDNLDQVIDEIVEEDK